MEGVVVLVYLEMESCNLRQVIVEFRELVVRDHCNWYARSEFEEDEEQEEDQYEYIPMKRYSYSREHKLAAIDYFQTI